MNRRGFLASILALGAAPAIVRADSLMRIVPRETEIVMPWAFAEEALPGVWVSPSATIDQIIAETIRHRAAVIEMNVRRHNALLRRIER